MGSTRPQKDEDTSRGAALPPLRHSLAVKPSNPGVPRSDSFLAALPLWWPFSQVSGIWLVYRACAIFHPDGTLCAPTQASLPKTHFVLQHVHVINDGEEDVKLIGVYSTRERAEQAVARLRSQPGFCDTPEGFSIDEYPVDQDHWTEGYVTVRSDPE
jgi:hypothetical protein